MNTKTCKKYAEVAVKIGVNIQKGQDAIIFASTRQANFVKYLVKECYKSGARKVRVEFHDEEIDKLNYKYESAKVLKNIDNWEIEKAKARSEQLPVLIHVDDDNPDAFSKLDLKKINDARIARRMAVKQYKDKEFLYCQWVIIALPSESWAKKVFPNETKKNAMKLLESAILKTARIDVEDPVYAWEEHIKDLKSHANYLNDINLDYLVYTSKNGTNLKIKLHPKHVWVSARSKSLQNIEYCANLPTEEVFTMPLRNGVDGIVYSSKPLVYNGQIIEDFALTFKEGRIVKVEAKTNQEVLQNAIDSDEGSHYLGEVALVPYNSPINQTGLLFYNTLFDENACCHLAFGQAFEENLNGYESLSKEELIKEGFNESVLHVDFMIGSEDLSIKGYDKNGKEYIIFEDGIWAYHKN